jgi:hypothetical protein
MDKKETVILYRGQIESLLSLSSLRDVKTILRAIVSYSMDGVEPEIPEHLAFGWQWFKHTIDAHWEQYSAKVEARRQAGIASAEKRGKCQQVSTNATNVDFVEQIQQVSTNATDKDKDKDLNRECVIRAHAYEAERIASLYPRAKVGNYRTLVESVIKAISREQDIPGTSPEEAVFKVESGTIAYAEAVKKWKHKKYISDAVKFFGSGMYNHDPATWEQPEAPEEKTVRKKVDPYDPSTWENN